MVLIGRIVSDNASGNIAKLFMITNYSVMLHYSLISNQQLCNSLHLHRCKFHTTWAAELFVFIRMHSCQCATLTL